MTRITQKSPASFPPVEACSDQSYGVFCEVWDGVTGHRAAWLKARGQIARFATKAEAEAEAERLTLRMHKTLKTPPQFSFSYSAREYR